MNRRAWIGLGSNLGDRAALLREAVNRLEQEPVVLGAISPLYRTAPVGGPPQGPYLNACISLDTALSPVSLLRRMQVIEGALGRVRLERWGPRTIDLDLLVHGGVIMHTPVLELPHPRLVHRDFVLLPLSMIAPDLVIPGMGRTVRRLLEGRPRPADIQLHLSSWYPR